MSGEDTLAIGSTPQRLGCLGWFTVVTFGAIVLLGVGAVVDAAWERYRPITDDDIVSACGQLVTDAATDWHSSTRTYVTETCNRALTDPALRERIREYLDERRK
ncbi:hypothetical protein [Promicromonospora sp. NPDC057488]|uniref:hypothetical protein n=1 Tax=Promicromonospora sp. NPDC057488 TaxID=3346147 RepID=UPI00366C29D9